MKIKTLIILALIGFMNISNAFEEEFLLRHAKYRSINEITEKTFDKWKVVSTFDNEGLLLREINFFNKEVTSDYHYNYKFTDTLFEIKKTNIITKEKKKKEVIYRYYYTPLGQCYKYGEYFSDFYNPSYYEYYFLYEDGMLKSYAEGKNGRIKTYCKYNQEKQKIQEIEIRNEIDTTFYYYIYNNRGQLTDYIKESHNDDVIYSDVVPWSKKKLNKIHIKYSGFDKRNNWTKSYFITEKGKVFRSERKIKYW